MTSNPFVCLFQSQAIHSSKHPQREWVFACTAICTPASRAVVLELRLWGELTSMLRICLYRRESIEGERRGVGNVSFRWQKKAGVPGENHQPAAGY